MIYELLFKTRVEETLNHNREDNTLYVTDLTRCSYRRVLEARFPDLKLQECYNPVLLLGNIVHYGLESFLKYLQEQGYFRKVDVEVEGYKRITFDDRDGLPRIITIKGRIDSIVYGDDGRFGVEIKSSKSDIGLPYDHHILQCKIYNWLFDLSKTILLYVTPERITEYEVSDKLTDEEVVKLILDSRSPKYPWECNYCVFKSLCPKKRSNSR